MKRLIGDLGTSVFRGFLLAIFLLAAAADSALAELLDDPFLIHPQFKTTLSAALLPSNRAELQQVRVNTQFQGQLNPQLSGRGSLTLGLLPARNTVADSLVILIPGVGGDASSSLTIYLADRVRNLGHHVVTIPNPVSAAYAIGVSRTGHPGYAAQDLAELEQLVIPRAIEAARAQGLRFNSVSLVGYSLGALYAAHLGAKTSLVAGLPVQRVLMLNPPVDSNHAISVLDRLYADGFQSMGGLQRGHVLSTLYNFFQYQSYDDPMAIRNRLNSLDLSEAELSWVVGRQFRTDLSALVGASQLVWNQGVIGNGTGRTAEAIDFRSYADLVMRTVPASAGVTGVYQLFAESSLEAIAGKIQGDNRFRIIHAADDFLLRSGDVEWVERQFLGRSRIFRRGGHLGYLWTQTFRSVLEQSLR